MSPTLVLTATIQEIYRASQLNGSRRPSRLRCFFVEYGVRFQGEMDKTATEIIQ